MTFPASSPTSHYQNRKAQQSQRHRDCSPFHKKLRDLVYDFALYDAQGLDLDLITNEETTSLQPFSVAIYTSLFLALPQTRRHELSKRPSTQHKTAIFMDRTFTPNQVVVFSSRS
ncbi:hypothetical protein LTR56_020107 [Elasticomyces elasticus]|nr:hypothetical protein LTR56_020107 [Elasticomyces elasticus]KAK4910978.1 hypothetical protein LTR49_020423 [Elasticomyces elasticus]